VHTHLNSPGALNTERGRQSNPQRGGHCHRSKGQKDLNTFKEKDRQAITVQMGNPPRRGGGKKLGN